MQNTLYIPIETSIYNPVECTKLVKRGDTVKLTIKVFTNGVLANLTGQSIDLILTKSDDTIIQKEIDLANISNGVVIATLDIQATVVAGIVSGELQINDANGQKSTNTFTFNVDASLADNAIEVSKNDINVLNDLRDLIATGETTITNYENHILAIANSIEAVEALENIKSYIDTNLSALENNNAQAVVNNNNLQSSISQAGTSKTALDESIEKSNQFAETHQDIENLVNQVNQNTTSLSDMTNEQITQNSNIANKVDKVVGKGLSTNDYDNTEKAEVAKIINKADISYVNTKTQANNLSYKESYDTLALLQTAYPTGDTYNHCVLADGFIYTYVNSAWTSTQVQANGTGIADDVIGYKNLTSDVKNKAFIKVPLSSYKAEKTVWYQQGVRKTDAGYKVTYHLVSGLSEIFVSGRSFSYRDFITFFDATDTYISSIYNNTASSVDYADLRVTVPNNASYVILSEYQQVYPASIKKLSNLADIQNIDLHLTNESYELDYSSSESGYYYGQTTKNTALNNIIYYYDISELKSINISGSVPQYYNIFTLLDDNGNVLDWKQSNEVAIYEWDIDIEVGSYTKLAISTSTSQGITWNVTTRYGLKQFSTKVQDKNTNWVTQRWARTEAKTYQQSTEYVYTNGVCNVYDVSSLEKVKIKITARPYQNAYTLFLNGSIVSYEYNNSASSVNYEEIIDVSGANELWITIDRGHEDTSKGAMYVLEEIPVNQWQGKTIGWWGTSIPAFGSQGYNHLESYPIILGSMIGATVQNHAVGESSIHCKDCNRIDAAYNPYGFVANFANCKRCLTNTVAEMQWLIDNYAIQDGSGNYIFTTNRPTSIDATEQALILSCSYENRLLPYLDTTDLFVFDHGHNDLADTGNHQYSTLITNYGTKNLYSYVGAMNFIMDIIKKNNQRARIVQISEYDNQENLYGVAKQKTFADLWQIPFFELYKYTGFSSSMTINTTGYWGTDGYWVESGGTAQDLTIKQLYLKDNLHPYTDRSGKTGWFIAEILRKFFLYQLS